MRHDTAMASAFTKAHVGVAIQGQLRGMAVDLLRDRKHLSNSEQNRLFRDMVLKDDQFVCALIDDYLDRIRADMRGDSLPGEGHSVSDAQCSVAQARQPVEGEDGHMPDEHQELFAPSPSPQHDRMGHLSRETHSRAARPAVPYKPRERTPSERLAALKSRAETAQVIITVYDTYKLANGRTIGDIRMGELESMRLKSASDAALIRLIQKHAVADPEAKVRDVVGIEMLQRYIQKGAEYADVA